MPFAAEASVLSAIVVVIPKSRNPYADRCSLHKTIVLCFPRGLGNYRLRTRVGLQNVLSLAYCTPDVDLRDILHPAQSVTDHALIQFVPVGYSNLLTNRMCLHRYLPSRFRITQDISVGADICLASSFAANAISVRSCER